jgi:hypothetical protein
MSHDLRRYARQTQFRLILGLILLVAIVGDALIYAFYGIRAALFGLLCIAGVMGPVLLIVIIFAIIDWIIKRSNRER